MDCHVGLLTLDWSLLVGRDLFKRASLDDIASTSRSATVGECKKDLEDYSIELDQHFRKITWNTLSKTFQEAIILTKSLGFRYLWIDCLCIVQDDPNDFEVECARMHFIYLRCQVMIAASDAPNSEHGLLRYWDEADSLLSPRPAFDPRVANRLSFRRSDQDLHAERRWNEWPDNLHARIRWDEWTKVLSGPLSTRGWAHQERQLAPRIIHYTDRGVMWECRNFIGAGNDEDLQSRWRLEVAFETCTRLLDRGVLYKETKECGFDGVMDTWMNTVEAYSKKSLTFGSDKLPALSGLAAFVSSLTQQNPESYLAGIWRSRIHQQLMWYPSVSLNRRHGKATANEPGSNASLPSWSWASWDGSVSFDTWRLFSLDHDHVRTVNCLVAEKTVCDFASDIHPSGQNPFGQVRRHRISFIARSRRYIMGVFTYDGDRGLFVNDTTKPTFELRLDAPHSTTITTEVHLVILMTTCHTGPTKRRGRLGIIIHKDPKGSSSWNFRRVGVFHIRNEEEANVSNWDAKEIVLV